MRAKKFTVVRKVEGGKDVTVATVKKEGRFSSVSAFMRSTLADTDTYYLTVEAGTDAAFMVALVTLIDEMFHDKPENPSPAQNS